MSRIRGHQRGRVLAAAMMLIGLTGCAGNLSDVLLQMVNAAVTTRMDNFITLLANLLIGSVRAAGAT